LNHNSLAIAKESLAVSEQWLEVDHAMVSAPHDLGAIRWVSSGSSLWVGGASWVEVDRWVDGKGKGKEKEVVLEAGEEEVREDRVRWRWWRQCLMRQMGVRTCWGQGWMWELGMKKCKIGMKIRVGMNFLWQFLHGCDNGYCNFFFNMRERKTERKGETKGIGMDGGEASGVGSPVFQWGLQTWGADYGGEVAIIGG